MNDGSRINKDKYRYLGRYTNIDTVNKAPFASPSKLSPNEKSYRVRIELMCQGHIVMA